MNIQLGSLGIKKRLSPHIFPDKFMKVETMPEKNLLNYFKFIRGD